MPRPRVLRFGIRSLDKLIGTTKYRNKDVYGIGLSESKAFKVAGKRDGADLPITSSVCLSGPDGTGKSVLSLHMASQYVTDCLGESPKKEDYSRIPKVLYISTDLTYNMALKGWDHFSLDRPQERREPLVELAHGRKPPPGRAPIGISLMQYFPAGNSRSTRTIVNYLERDASRSSRLSAEVCFVDLASRTAGDDWGFVHRVLSTMEQPPKNEPRHLVILDAIEGLEAVAGDLNAFGENSSRRSRIAQVMRLAAGKCHLVFVIEEASEERFPEEFVTDVVVRLRNNNLDRYSRRTVEIEKARGQWNIRGQHPYVIRDGKGSTSGTQNNADEPEVSKDLKRAAKKKYQSYVHVFPSLNYISRGIMIDRYKPRDNRSTARFAGFGITYLDDMLASAREEAKRDPYSDRKGLPSGTTAALIGDSLTQKSQLGRAFLSRTFYPYAKALADRIDKAAEGLVIRGHSVGAQVADIRRRMTAVNLTSGQPVAVMFTTQGVNNEDLTNDFYEWLVAAGGPGLGDNPAKRRVFKQDLQTHIRNHTICRRFEIHDVPSPILMHIFHRNVEAAQRKMFQLKEERRLPSERVRFRDSWRIRIVVDDLNSFRDIFPEMSGDPLMLPALLFMLRREGVTSLIIDTQSSGSPELSITERFHSSVRELVEHRIYTWRLPFYGENRIAISLIPPISQEAPGVIRELRWETKADPIRDRSLRVDPHFELYMGLEKGKPQPVPLEIRLYAETPSLKKYVEAEAKFFNEIFAPVIWPAKPESPGVIRWSEVTDYDALRDSSRLQRDTRLDHTTLLQVDEFWLLRRATHRRAGAFRQQWNYLSAVTAGIRGESESDFVADPFGIFQRPGQRGEKTRPDRQQTAAELQEMNTDKRRLHFFDDDCGYEFRRIREDEKDGSSAEEKHRIDRVPFTWDFGFLLCNAKAWEEAFHLRINNDRLRVTDIADAPRLVAKLRNKNNAVSRGLRTMFSAARLKLIDKCKSPKQVDQRLIAAIVDELNKLLGNPLLYEQGGFQSVRLSEETRQLLSQPGTRTGENREMQHPTRINRMLLEDAFPREIPKRTVEQVWHKLRKASETNEQKSSHSKARAGKGSSVSWREFLAASKVVAEFQSYRTSMRATAFDFTMLSPEAFSCLILEMWLSESYISLTKAARKRQGLIDHGRGNRQGLKEEMNRLRAIRRGIVNRVARRRWSWETNHRTDLEPRTLLEALNGEKDYTLTDILRMRIRTTTGATSKRKESAKPIAGYSLELYKVWLLLIEVLDFADLVDSPSHLKFEFKSRDVSSHAVSSRHWYKTASKFIDSLTPEQLEYNWAPVRLPGHFSVRSDWFLAVAGGSRSGRLADHALDLLSSQRANVTRLQEGIGLPTRRLFFNDPERASRLRTRLISCPAKGQPLENVEYDKLRGIGATNARKGRVENSEEFYWLWRSGIWAYNRYSRIWHKWLNRTLLHWHSWRQRYGSNWTSGFKAYDLLTEIEFGDPALSNKRLNEFESLNLNSWNQFHEVRNILIAELEQVSIFTI